jgi:hypothetical protein
LIIVLGPQDSNIQWEREKFDADTREKHILHMINNVERLDSGQSPIPNPYLTVNQPAAPDQPKPAAEQKATAGPPKPNPILDLLGPEFYNLIKNRLVYKIKIKNVRIYYEDTQLMEREHGVNTKDKNFSLDIILNDVVLDSTKIDNHLDEQGNFKDWVNISKLSKNLYGKNVPEWVYLANTLRHFAVEIYVGNEVILPPQVRTAIELDLKIKDPKVRQEKMQGHIRYFGNINDKRDGTKMKIFQIDE